MHPTKCHFEKLDFRSGTTWFWQHEGSEGLVLQNSMGNDENSHRLRVMDFLDDFMVDFLVEPVRVRQWLGSLVFLSYFPLRGGE